jgi:hypothetical protein
MTLAGNISLDEFVETLNAVSSNTVFDSRAVSDKDDFFVLTGGLGVDLYASPSEPFIYGIKNAPYTLEANVSLTLPDNAHNFMWVGPFGELGSAALPCRYDYKAPGAPATDQHWFDLSVGRMMRWDGAVWEEVERIFLGYIRTDGGVANSRYTCEKNLSTPYTRYKDNGDGRDGFLDLNGGTYFLDRVSYFTAVVLRNGARIDRSGTGFGVGLQGMYWQGSMVLFGGSLIKVLGPNLDAPSTTNGAQANNTSGSPSGAGGGGGSVGTGAAVGAYTLMGSLNINTAANAVTPITANGANSTNKGCYKDYLICRGKPQSFCARVSAGGGGGSNGVDPGKIRAFGSGPLFLVGNTLGIDATSEISSDAEDGMDGVTAGIGGGGGAPAGTNHVETLQLFDDNGATFTAVSGVGGLGGAGAGNGGDVVEDGFWRKIRTAVAA